MELWRTREKNGLSRDQAAAGTKGSPQNIGHIETARTLPKPLELDALPGSRSASSTCSRRKLIRL